jgi:hypothetical protein
MDTLETYQRWLWRRRSCRASLWRLWSMCLLPWLLPSLYRLEETSQWSLEHSLWPKEVWKRMGVNSMRKCICSWGFHPLEPVVLAGGTAGRGCTHARQSCWCIRYFGCHFLIRTPVFFISLDSYGRGLQHDGLWYKDIYFELMKIDFFHPSND